MITKFKLTTTLLLLFIFQINTAQNETVTAMKKKMCCLLYK